MASPALHISSNEVLSRIWAKIAAFAPTGVELTNDTEIFVDEALYNDSEVGTLETVGGCTREARDGAFIIKLACAPANNEPSSPNVQAAAKDKEWA